MIPVPSHIDRRLLLASGLGVVGLAAGCDLLDAADPSPSPTGSPTTPASDDEVLRHEVTVAMAETAALGTATAERFGRLRSLVEGFVELHGTHGAMLGGLPEVTPPQVAGRRARARRVFLATEERLQQRLVEAAVAADSGALAQALAAMAAGVSQRRAVTR